MKKVFDLRSSILERFRLLSAGPKSNFKAQEEVKKLESGHTMKAEFEGAMMNKDQFRLE